MGIGLVMVVEKDKAKEVVNFINNRYLNNYWTKLFANT